jgi:hypothetical protein
MRFGRANAVLMTLFGMGPLWSSVDVDGEHVRVKMGWAFSATIPRTAITGAKRRGYVWWAFGVHSLGWAAGRWIVNGSGHNVVEVTIDPPARARVLGFRVKLREVWLSLDDPDGFIAAVGR